MTTSYLVAETFGKAHKRVLEDIDRLGCSDSFREPNFGLSLKLRELPNGGHKEERFYVITKDGFTLLAMGYTEKKAMLFKSKSEIVEEIAEEKKNTITCPKCGAKFDFRKEEE